MTLTDKIRNSIVLKLATTSFLLLVLMIPIGKTENLIYERESRKNSAVNEISSKWGGYQTITAPVLVIPYRRYYTEKKIVRMVIENAYFLPEDLKVEGVIDTQVRYRGIFEAILYRGDFTLSGSFQNPDFSTLGISGPNILWNRAYIAAGITDLRGIADGFRFAWNDRAVDLLPGAEAKSVFDSGVKAPISLGSRVHRFRMNLSLKGSSGIQFVPVGKNTVINLKSPWRHPGFTGAFLPEKRSISGSGFEAGWNISYLGRNYPQQFTDEKDGDMRSRLMDSAFGTEFVVPANNYQKATRSLKYSLLFLSLTFSAFFMFEIIYKLRLHPFQYLLIGFAMTVFYLLFASLSEHLSFLIAYLLSAISVIGVITGYSWAILQARNRALVLASLLTILYSYLYIVLENEDYSLVLGAIALFIALSVVMYLTRKIDWYRIKFQPQAEV